MTYFTLPSGCLMDMSNPVFLRLTPSPFLKTVSSPVFWITVNDIIIPSITKLKIWDLRLFLTLLFHFFESEITPKSLAQTSFLSYKSLNPPGLLSISTWVTNRYSRFNKSKTGLTIYPPHKICVSYSVFGCMRCGRRGTQG